MMYSCETLLSIGGNPFWGDLLEREAFNSMPATTTPDMWAHQYLQMTNQISAARIPDAEKYIVEIEMLVQQKEVPPPINGKQCKKCAYYEYCYI